MAVDLNKVTKNLAVHSRRYDLQTKGRVEHALVDLVYSATAQRNYLLYLRNEVLCHCSSSLRFVFSQLGDDIKIMLKIKTKAKDRSFSGNLWSYHAVIT